MIYLGNKNGGYMAFSEKARSKYYGIFFAEKDTLFKVVEDIRFLKEKESISEKQQQEESVRTGEDGTQETFSFKKSALIYEKKSDEEIELILDIRKSYDNREFGRYYTVSEENKKIRVKYRKENDAREDPGEEYNYEIEIDCDGAEYKLTEKWIPQYYDFDKKREDGNGKRYVFSLLTTRAKKICISHRKRKEFRSEGRKELRSKGMKELRSEGMKELRSEEAEIEVANGKWQMAKSTSFLWRGSRGGEAGILQISGQWAVGSGKKMKKNEETFLCAKNALEDLLTNMYGRTGLLAGHPWFFQYWTRDEGISTRGLCLIGKKKEAKEILMNAIQNIDENGRIPNRIPKADIGCADGVGWTFFRLKELFEENQLTKKETAEGEKKLRISLERMEKNLMKDGLVMNNRLETWMDTDWENDNRAGQRIEIQALTREMYRFLHMISGSEEAKQKAENLKKKIRQVFWSGQYLKDGSDDETVRPNLFLAAYVSPDLLNESEWESCFDIALKKLWLNWGGITSIDTDSPLFCDAHTGQNNQSYHRGDSWYFMNNIAAICLLKSNKKYIQYVKKIFKASQKDLFELGAKGACSEISSAKAQTSEGCFNQAWSDATLIELCCLMKEKGGFGRDFDKS